MIAIRSGLDRTHITFSSEPDHLPLLKEQLCWPVEREGDLRSCLGQILHQKGLPAQGLGFGAAIGLA
jgi:hypothetical protein